MKSLASLVQSLPPELYNEIYKLTFAPGFKVQQVDRNYKPPSRLQVNRSTRNRLLDSYYGKHTIFQIWDTSCKQWFESLPIFRTLCKSGHFLIENAPFEKLDKEAADYMKKLWHEDFFESADKQFEHERDCQGWYLGLSEEIFDYFEGGEVPSPPHEDHWWCDFHNQQRG